jgi:hypothetical protein
MASLGSQSDWIRAASEFLLPEGKHDPDGKQEHRPWPGCEHHLSSERSFADEPLPPGHEYRIVVTFLHPMSSHEKKIPIFDVCLIGSLPVSLDSFKAGTNNFKPPQFRLQEQKDLIVE